MGVPLMLDTLIDGGSDVGRNKEIGVDSKYGPPHRHVASAALSPSDTFIRAPFLTDHVEYVWRALCYFWIDSTRLQKLARILRLGGNRGLSVPSSSRLLGRLVEVTRLKKFRVLPSSTRLGDTGHRCALTIKVR